MSRALTVTLLAAGLAAGAALLWFNLSRPGAGPQRVSVSRSTSEAPVYYRHPDGRPEFSAAPRMTTDGKAFVPVYEDEDSVSFAPKAKAASTENRRIKYYRNPMGLPDTSLVPKTDSMGMEYIPIYEGEVEDDGVKLSAGKIQRSGVQSERAALRVIQTRIRAPGTVQLDERRVAVISMRTDSWIQKVSDVTTGSRVRKGQPLMEIYSPAITSVAAEYTALRKSNSLNQDISAGARQRLVNLAIPESLIASLEKDKVALLSITWPAPRDGIVLERNVSEGMRAGAGDVLFRLADLSIVWALIDVAERDVGALKVGLLTEVKARAHAGRVFTGLVAVVYPQINKETRTARVRIELQNRDFVLLPDMYVDAEISVGEPNEVVAIPDSAVIDSGSRQVVFIDKGDGKFEPREVKLGARGGGYTEVREGLVAGENVVTAATFLVDAESNLNAALKSYNDAGKTP